jgi:hypothetical protein
MAAYRRYSLLSLLVLMTGMALGVGWWAASARWARERQALVDQFGSPPRAPNDYLIRNAPLTISCSEVGHYAVHYSWHLSVNSAGQGVLEIEKPRDPVRVSLQLSDKQIRAFREQLISHDFFSLDPDYGDKVPDGSTKTVTVVAGDRAKTVRIHFLMNMAQTFSARAKLQEAGRALRLWTAVREWVDHPEAVDSRQYNQRVLSLLER